MREKENKSRKFAKQLRKNMTKAEIILWANLKGAQLEGFKFRRQHPIGPFIADFANLKMKLVLEVDGETHTKDEHVKYDESRTKYLESKGWKVIRFWNTEIYENLEGVIETILKHLPKQD